MKHNIGFAEMNEEIIRLEIEKFERVQNRKMVLYFIITFFSMLIAIIAIASSS